VRLQSVSPLRARCSSPDFVRNSLGLCKHVFARLLAIPERVLSAALAGRRALAADRTDDRAAELRWDPTHPLHGDWDRAARLRASGRRLPGRLRQGPLPRSALRTPAARVALLRSLRRAIAARGLRADPAAVRVVDEDLARAEAVMECERAFPAARHALRSLRRRMYPCQREAAHRSLRTGRLLLADGMGLGKTTQAIACCHALLESKTVRRALLVVPASLKPQWGRQWSAVSDAPVQIVEGRAVERARACGPRARVALVVGYEQLLRDVEAIRAWAPDLVVLDEAQRIKSSATKAAQIVKTLAPRYRIALTGTPMENRLDEFASIVEFVDDVALEPKWRLQPQHLFADGDRGEGRAGARHLDQLRERLAPVMLPRHRSEVVDPLPDRTDTRVDVALTDRQREEHDALHPPIASLVGRAARRSLTQREFLHLMQLFTEQRMVANGLAQVRFEEVWPDLEGRRPSPASLDALFASKLSVLRDLLEELAVVQRRKTVTFSQWRNMLRLADWAVRDVLGDAGLRAAFFTGAERPALRERAIVDFHDDPATAVLFLTDAGGTGLNLQRAASACIQLELPWNPAVMEQRISRIHRPDQSRPIDVDHLVASDCIESRIAAIVGRKRALCSALFDGGTDTVLFDSSAAFVDTLRDLCATDPSPDAAEPLFRAAAAPEDDPPADELPAGACYPDALPARARDLDPHDTGASAAGALDRDALPARARDVGALPANVQASPPPTPSAAAFAVRPRPDGGLTIDVPPYLAPQLAAVFAALADALRHPDAPPPAP
jgi:superfamily II DNA or RNA helicase